MISLPQIQLACDICEKRVEVEIEQSYIGNSSDFYFDADEWMEEHGWRRLDSSIRDGTSSTGQRRGLAEEEAMSTETEGRYSAKCVCGKASGTGNVLEIRNWIEQHSLHGIRAPKMKVERPMEGRDHRERN